MRHIPVMLCECIEGLDIKPGGTYVDGCVGLGGHAREIVRRLDTGSLIAIDRDAEAIKRASESLSEYSGKITFIHGNFADISGILDSCETDLVDGMLFDLGVSSMQLDTGERGFSYNSEAVLDMRMDKREALTAFDAVNNWPEEKLRKTFFEFGEERYAVLIARAIVRKRIAAPINTTFDLNEVISSAMPAASRREKQHPSKRCYQALRLAVNDELGSLGKMLDSAPDRLKTGGRLCVISYHSLEDRLCKRVFTARAKGCICPKDLPVCACGISPSLEIITRKAIIPTEAEVERNPRARSGKLRIAQRI